MNKMKIQNSKSLSTLFVYSFVYSFTINERSEDHLDYEKMIASILPHIHSYSSDKTYSYHSSLSSFNSHHFQVTISLKRKLKIDGLMKSKFDLKSSPNKVINFFIPISEKISN
jgi:hypothetical protein